MLRTCYGQFIGQNNVILAFAFPLFSFENLMTEDSFCNTIPFIGIPTLPNTTNHEAPNCTGTAGVWEPSAC